MVLLPDSRYSEYPITVVTLTKVSGKILFRLNQHHNLL
jgi:hypothetical protein